MKKKSSRAINPCGLNTILTIRVREPMLATMKKLAKNLSHETGMEASYSDVVRIAVERFAESKLASQPAKYG